MKYKREGVILEWLPYENIEHCLTPKSKEIYQTPIPISEYFKYEYEVGKFTDIVSLRREVKLIENVIPAAEVLVKKFTEGVEKGVYDFGTIKGASYGRLSDGTYLVIIYPVLSEYTIRNKHFKESARKNGFIEY